MKDRIKIFLTILNIAILSLLIGYSYADFSYILQPHKRVPEPIIEIIKPAEASLNILNETEEKVKTAIVNIIPEKEAKTPIYIKYISNAISIFLHNSIFSIFFTIPILFEFFREKAKISKFKIDKKYYGKIEKIGIIMLSIGLLANLFVNCFYAGLGLRIFGFAFFYLFECIALILTYFPIINYFRNRNYNEFLNDAKIALPLMLSLFFAGAFEESVYLLRW